MKNNASQRASHCVATAMTSVRGMRCCSSQPRSMVCGTKGTWPRCANSLATASALEMLLYSRCRRRCPHRAPTGVYGPLT